MRLDQKTYVEKIEKAVADGSVVLIENIGESVDPILDPVIGRNTIKKVIYTGIANIQQVICQRYINICRGK